jgi:hypothetical protein
MIRSLRWVPRCIYSWLTVPIRLRRTHRSDALARVNISLGPCLRQSALARPRAITGAPLVLSSKQQQPILEPMGRATNHSFKLLVYVAQRNNSRDCSHNGKVILGSVRH